jgi:hypothetical protein
MEWFVMFLVIYLLGNVLFNWMLDVVRSVVVCCEFCFGVELLVASLTLVFWLVNRAKDLVAFFY